VVKRMDMTPGAASPRVNKGEPHSEQKLRVARLPLPARTEYVFGVPVIAVSDTWMMKPEAKGAPPAIHRSDARVPGYQSHSNGSLRKY
jgi:hypothetical protein